MVNEKNMKQCCVSVPFLNLNLLVNDPFFKSWEYNLFVWQTNCSHTIT